MLMLRLTGGGVAVLMLRLTGGGVAVRDWQSKLYLLPNYSREPLLLLLAVCLPIIVATTADPNLTREINQDILSRLKIITLQ